MKTVKMSASELSCWLQETNYETYYEHELESYLAITRDNVEKEFELDEDDPLETMANFYKAFCETCNPTQCNHCPGYVFLANFGYHERDNNIQQEIEELTTLCSSKCKNCVHIGQFYSDYCSSVYNICLLGNETSDEECSDKEPFCKNQITLDEFILKHINDVSYI